jgi:hypothetical protein
MLLALAAQPAAAATPAAPPERARFQGLFVDWSSANRQSIDTERAAAERPAPPSATQQASAAAAGSVALGERVGDIVALGDCAEGERVARNAGDFALVAAVRQHCAAADPQR